MALRSLVPTARRHLPGIQVAIGPVTFGGHSVPVIGGPCSVEPGYVDHARMMAATGINALRGCVHKPRTKPGTFQGLGADGLHLLDEARAATGLPIVAEPLSVEQVGPLLAHVDALQIGARSMQNTPLLRAAGRSGLPVILKRGMAATLDEWLGAAEYILAEGNDQVILCERGIRTFETATRNTLDLSCIPVLRERSPLPVIVDPSHAAGNRDWVPALAMAAVAAGADGLLIEAHPDPIEAWSDAGQAITPVTLAEIVRGVALLTTLTREMAGEGVAAGRDGIDRVDVAIGVLLERRAELVAVVQSQKAADSLPVRDLRRERDVVRRVAAEVPRLAEENVARVMSAVIDACIESAWALSDEEDTGVRELTA
ncbi:MAG: hypothetical protein NVSMB29_11440 [Candidatus Dormibacteria bacterium]